MKNAVLVLAIVLLFFGCTQAFSENQVTLVTDDVPTQTSNSFFGPKITIMNQSDKQIVIKNIVCEICDPNKQSLSPLLAGGAEVPADSSKQFNLNGELNQYLKQNGEYKIPAEATIFTVNYSVEGEPKEQFHILQYKR